MEELDKKVSSAIDPKPMAKSYMDMVRGFYLEQRVRKGWPCNLEQRQVSNDVKSLLEHIDWQHAKMVELSNQLVNKPILEVTDPKDTALIKGLWKYWRQLGAYKHLSTELNDKFISRFKELSYNPDTIPLSDVPCHHKMQKDMSITKMYRLDWLGRAVKVIGVSTHIACSGKFVLAAGDSMEYNVKLDTGEGTLEYTPSAEEEEVKPKLTVRPPLPILDWAELKRPLPYGSVFKE